MEQRDKETSHQLSPFKVPQSVRKKVPPGTGYSPHDWMQLEIPPSQPRRISSQELALHATPQDCWIAIQGRVYDVTRYLPFHPGGKGQLLRGKGNDATELFMKTHPWVNPEALLKKCWLGFIVRGEIKE